MEPCIQEGRIATVETEVQNLKQDNKEIKGNQRVSDGRIWAVLITSVGTLIGMVYQLLSK